MRTIYTLAILFTFIVSGQLLMAQCIDPSRIDSSVICPKVYQPVCGCNNVTYSNACEAEYRYGITSYEPRICHASLLQCCQAAFEYSVNIGTAGYAVSFNNTSSGCFTAQQWDFGNGSGSQQFEPSHTYLASQFPVDGRAQVCLTVYNLPDSCYDKICRYVHFDYEPYPCVDSSLITSNPCPIPLVTVCGCNGVQYDSGCEATNDAGITAWHTGLCPVDTSCKASFGYSISNTSNGSVVQFTNTSPTANMAYAWDFGDGNTSSQQHPSQVYTMPDNYTVCLRVTDSITNCTSNYCRRIQVSLSCVDSNLIEVLPVCPTVVDPVCGCNGITYSNFCLAASAGLQYWRPGPCGTEQCYAYFDYAIDTVSGEVTFNNRSSSGTAFAFWQFNGTTSSDVNPVHTFTMPGTYPVCLSITNGSCTAFYCDTLYLGISGLGQLGNVISPKVYPNPFSGQVHVIFHNQTDTDITVWVTDLSGKQVATLVLDGLQTQTFTWNATGYPAGYYLLHYQSGGETGIEKLLLLR